MRGLLLTLALCLGSAVQASSLLDLYQETLESDPRLQVALAESDIFSARERYSRGALLPQVSLSAQGTRTKREVSEVGLEESYYGERYSAVLRQSLYNKAQWEALRSSRHEADEYLARYEDTEAQVTVDLAERYTRVLATEDNLHFVAAEREAAEAQLRQIRARYERQMAMITDLLEVEARVDRLLTEELEAAHQVQLAREEVSELIGRELEEPLAPLREQILLDIELNAVDEWLTLGLANNHSLSAARLAVEAARAGVREARGRRHPTIDLQLSAQRTDIGYENAQSPEMDVYVAALNLNMPIFSGGQTSAQVAESRARQRLAEQQLEELERRARRDIREAYLTTRSAMERVSASGKAVVSAEKSYEARQRGLQYGTVTAVDVLDAAENLYRAHRDHRQAYYDLMVQFLRLHQTTGMLSPTNVVELDAWLDASTAAEISALGELPNT